MSGGRCWRQGWGWPLVAVLPLQLGRARIEEGEGTGTVVPELARILRFAASLTRKAIF